MIKNSGHKLLNSQLLAIFLPFATKQATMPHYPEFTDRYSAQYGMLLFSLHFMTNTFFSTFLLPPPSPHFHFVSQLHIRSTTYTLAVWWAQACKVCLILNVTRNRLKDIFSLNGNNSHGTYTPQYPPSAIIHSAGFTTITPSNLLSLEYRIE